MISKIDKFLQKSDSDMLDKNFKSSLNPNANQNDSDEVKKLKDKIKELERVIEEQNAKLDAQAKLIEEQTTKLDSFMKLFIQKFGNFDIEINSTVDEAINDNNVVNLGEDSSS